MSERANEVKLRELADREAIRDLARRYAHCVWQKDVDGAIALFTDDAEMDTGDRPPIIGRKALLESYAEMFAANEFRPFVHNHVIELYGDQAEGTCYLDLRSVVEGNVARRWFSPAPRCRSSFTNCDTNPATWVE